MNKFALYTQIFKNMGWDYVQFRTIYELKRRTGLLKKAFPTNPSTQSFCALEEWKKLPTRFFFEARETLSFPKQPHPALKTAFENFRNGQLRYFNAAWLEIGRDYDWMTNPATHYRYDIRQHWTEVEDISKEAGDIKYVWEKSRFSYLYSLIRYDYHFAVDCAEIVFSEIDNWIAANPINQGPNYKCSQEISLRTLNWLFALYYYKNSPELHEERFQRILHVIYWQLQHVYHNINFSRKTVRNNHAITEVMMLYLGGLLFPFFPEAAKWKRQGKQWFEQEIAYQIYEDGTFLQFSHNYHRVLVQLLSWAFGLAELNGEQFSALTYQRAAKSLDYLYQCTDPEHGQLPNYGANDGALFFPLNNQDYRDYRPQLNALAYVLERKVLFKAKECQEDLYWLTGTLKAKPAIPVPSIQRKTLARFSNGGYYLWRDADTFSFIRCGSHRDRPSHADNLHLDLWYQGKNILRDAGTYKYNTDEEFVRYFNGSKAHNTVTLGDFDQMLKGPRFIWLYWTEALEAKLEENADTFYFRGKVRAFQQVGEGIIHQRKVTKFKGRAHWIIEDEVQHATDHPVVQHWNPAEDFAQYFDIRAVDANNQAIAPDFQKGYYSSYYGVKEECRAIRFKNSGKRIITTIKAK